MTEEIVAYEPIGVIQSPFDSPEGMPVQPIGASDAVGTVEVDDAYADGLMDLEGFSHCILLYHFHRAGDDVSMQVEPFLDETDRGLFSTRAPQRPNRIGLSVVQIDSVDGREVNVRGIDVVDGTPLVDLKPFVPDFDVPDDADTGWMDASTSTVRSKRADDRFC
ncbi:tRNA (N6-threonylcarbamoyladenosine(37)-N6)-methyltransferase TrmO [Natronobacterium gregoryi]|uniref:Methyltransferase, YaeB/AF_0241 family n=2 Tax=Natronobacterium gregoryi TaxID=44930 RepID=L0AJ97_NATGS|nr:tRNA (N6-threonylcarbamoyladenosine(37)-N6)-methyltransferase TrmO [Natronobacterium gregoryi]AFZ73242.1 putative methyltransferase, YaeB/AF_0241 family [Natronobacterium gregoryi SP2]ELY71299.1 hypothetical protein C490_05192 [Natronobacterium gregoryi SP2]PLK21649.1 tRNA (N6-threonylcarbamoyladenosine(37)-N6)-methyltransferase TrmO [Natronobacterium gregoryi SP2]SFI57649.1 tRNA-Thr(GGU) m(6)t(6)A37 methyltransferase TsaA [Natronobacterium gregoryi]